MIELPQAVAILLLANLLLWFLTSPFYIRTIIMESARKDYRRTGDKRFQDIIRDASEIAQKQSRRSRRLLPIANAVLVPVLIATVVLLRP